MATAIVEVNCSICEKLALLALCKVDEHLRPVHEECPSRYAVIETRIDAARG
jgi:hypothetical protein